jgi:hypothetical protein
MVFQLSYCLSTFNNMEKMAAHMQMVQIYDNSSPGYHVQSMECPSLSVAYYD